MLVIRWFRISSVFDSHYPDNCSVCGMKQNRTTVRKKKEERKWLKLKYYRMVMILKRVLLKYRKWIKCFWIRTVTGRRTWIIRLLCPSALGGFFLLPHFFFLLVQNKKKGFPFSNLNSFLTQNCQILSWTSIINWKKMFLSPSPINAIVAVNNIFQIRISSS